MSLLADELEDLFKKTVNEIPIHQITRPEYKKKMDDICKDIPYYVAVVHLPSIMPVYFSPKSLEYLGMPDLKFGSLNMGFYRKVLHPDNAVIFQHGIAHFFSFAEQLFPFTCKIKVPHKGWRWVYGCSKMLSREETGGAKHTITMLCDVEEVFEKQIATSKQGLENILTEEQRRLYLLLTTREKEILHLIAQEASSDEIAEKLFISEHTVRSHRKSLLKKLNVKSSVGLARFDVYQSALGQNGI